MLGHRFTTVPPGRAGDVYSKVGEGVDHIFKNSVHVKLSVLHFCDVRKCHANMALFQLL